MNGSNIENICSSFSQIIMNESNKYSNLLILQFLTKKFNGVKSTERLKISSMHCKFESYYTNFQRSIP